MADLSLLARSVPESTLARIGAVMVLWGAIEHHMDRVLWRLLEVDIAIGREVTVTMNFRAKKRAIERLMERKKVRGPVRKVVDMALALAHEHEEDRNLIAHGFWFGNEFEGVPPDASSFARRMSDPAMWGSKSFGDVQMDEIISSLHHTHEALRLFAESPDSWRLSLREIRAQLPGRRI